MGGAVEAGVGSDKAAMLRRQKLSGPSGPAGLVANKKVLGIAVFACLGGFLYGYNQGVFSGVLAMKAFERHVSSLKTWFDPLIELGLTCIL
jgi:hypothetical protein